MRVRIPPIYRTRFSGGWPDSAVYQAARELGILTAAEGSETAATADLPLLSCPGAGRPVSLLDPQRPYPLPATQIQAQAGSLLGRGPMRV